MQMEWTLIDGKERATATNDGDGQGKKCEKKVVVAR